MTTRIYTKVSGAVGVTPTTWNFASQINPVTVPGTTTPNDGSLMTSKTETISVTNPHADAFGRTIWGPLAPQTITGTVKGQMRGSESNALSNVTLALAIKIVTSAGADRGVLLAQTASDSATAGHELVASTLTNMSFQDVAESAAITLTSQTAQSGDYLVIEWGIRSAQTTASRTVTLSYGNDNATDLPENTSATVANNPWWEFSQTLFNHAGDSAQTQGNGTLSADGSVGIGGASAQTAGAATISATGAIAITGDSSQTQDYAYQSRQAGVNACNYAVTFANQRSVTIFGSVHALGTKALRVQCYDLSSPAQLFQPASVTVHPTTFDVVVSFRQSQSGTVVLNGAKATLGPQGNYAQAFTAAFPTLTIAGTTHRLGTKNLLVDVYDTASPAARLEPGSVTVDATTFDVVLTFRQAQSGRVVLCGYGDTGATLNLASTFSGVTSHQILGSGHALGTGNIGVEVYDNSTPAVRIAPASVTIATDSTGTVGSFDVTVAFDPLQAQSGFVVLNGSAQTFAGAVAVTQGAATSLSAGTLALAGVATLSQGSASLVSASALALTGGTAVSQASATLASTGSLAVSGVSTFTLGAETILSAGTLPLAGAVTQTAGSETLLSAGGATTLNGDVSLTQGTQSLVTAATLALQGVASVSQAAESLLAAGTLPLSGTLALTATSATSLVAGTLPLASTAPLSQSAETLLSTGSSGTQGTAILTQAATTLTTAGSLALQGAVSRSSASQTLVMTGALPIGGTLSTSQGSMSLIATGTLSLQAVSTLTHGTMSLVNTGSLAVQAVGGLSAANQTLLAAGTIVSELPNVEVPFTNKLIFTIPQATHGLTTAAILVQVYDDQTPLRHQLTPGSVTIDASLTVEVRFDQLQNGTVVLNGALPSAATFGNMAIPFTNTDTVTIPQALHQFTTTGLLIQAYDTQVPAALLTPSDITVDSSSLQVVVRFRQFQSGTVIVCGHAALGTSNVTLGFTNKLTVSLPESLHHLGTKNLLVQVYDTSVPPRLIEPGSVTVDPNSHDIAVTFRQFQDGTLVVNGSLQVAPTLAILTQAPQQLVSTGTVAVTGTATLTQAAQSGVIAGAQELANYVQGFTNTNSISIPGVTHQLQTTALLVAVYDAASPAALIIPASVSVAPGSFNVLVTLLDQMSGSVVLSNSLGTTGPHGNVAWPLVAQQNVIIHGFEHGLGTNGLFVQIYDNQQPAHLVEPASVTVDPNLFDVTIQLLDALTGFVILSGYARNGGLPHAQIPFTNKISLPIPVAQHGLSTKNIIVQVYDDQSPANLMIPGDITIDTNNFTVTLSWQDAVNGTVILNGSVHSGTGQAALLQGSATPTSTGVLAITGSVGQTTSQGLISGSALLLQASCTPTQGSAGVLSAGVLPLQGVCAVSASPASLVSAGTSTRSGALSLPQGNQLLASTGSLGALGASTLTQAAAMIQATSTLETWNYVTGFSAAGGLQVSIPGVTHGCGTAALILQVYDAQIPAVIIEPVSITVDSQSFDVLITFAQPQDGTVVINSACATQPLFANAAIPFSNTQNVQVDGATHRLGTKNIVCVVYDTSPLPRLVEPQRVTVHPNTFQVIVTFAQPQSGLLVLCGSAKNGTKPNGIFPFINKQSVSIPGFLHGLGTRNLIAQAYNAAVVAAQISMASVTVDPLSADLTVTFAQPQSGTIVLNGSAQQGVGQVAGTTTETCVAAGTLLLQGISSLMQGVATVLSTGTAALQGVVNIPQGSQTLLAAGTSVRFGSSTMTQGNEIQVMQGALQVQGVALLTLQSQTVVSTGTSAHAGSMVTSMGTEIAAGTASLALTSTSATLAQQAQTLLSVGTIAPTGQLDMAQAPMTVLAAGTLPLAMTGTLLAASATFASTGSLADTGTMITTAASAGLISSASLAITGGSSLTQASATAVITGNVLIMGQSVLACAAESLIMAAGLLVTGTVTRTQAGQTGISQGTSTLAGAVAVTQDSAFLVASTFSVTQGSSIQFQAPQTVLSDGTSALHGASSLVQASATGVSAGTLPLAGMVQGSQVAGITGAGSLTLTGASSLMQAAQLSSATMVRNSVADVAATQASQTLTAQQSLLLAGDVVVQSTDAVVVSQANSDLQGNSVLMQMGQNCAGAGIVRYRRTAGGRVSFTHGATQVDIFGGVIEHLGNEGEVALEEEETVSAGGG